MGKRRKSSIGGGGEGSAMDMMSCLIGCLILILIGILLIIMVSQALVVVANPEKMKIEYIQLSEIDAIKEDKAFPNGNTKKEPIYIDVHRDHIKFYPTQQEVPIREVDIPGSPFRKQISVIKQHKDKMYVVLLVRPNAAKRARWLKEILFERELIDVGVDLVQSTTVIEYDTEASATYQEMRDQLKLKDQEIPISPPQPEAAESSPFPGAGSSGN